jgi:hypothetical protein
MSSELAALGVGGGGGGGPTVLILDQFTDANGTALPSHAIAPTNVPGTSWSVDHSNYWDIQSDEADSTAASAGSFGPAWCDAGQADVTIACDLESVTADNYGIVGRLQDASNYWLGMVHSGDGTVRLYEVSAGTLVLRSSYALTVTGKQTIQLVLSGTSLTLSVQGQSGSAGYTSSDFETNTKHGLYRNNNAGDRWDNFQVTHP